MFDSCSGCTHGEACPEGTRVPDTGRRGESQSCETDGQDETPQDHLRDPQSQHDPGAGPVLPQAGQTAGQRRGAEGARAADAAPTTAAAPAAASAARQRV